MALLWLPSGYEPILIVLGILVVFGANKIPQFMRGIGQGVREFKKGISGDDEKEKTAPDTQKENTETKP
jgi:sec-independent protein translocase protein TatA